MNVCIKYKKCYIMKELMLIKQVHYSEYDICEYDICQYWYFFNYSFKFQPNVCNKCHDFLMMLINFSNIASLNSKGSDYCCIISLMSKSQGL